jgi:hypothetical protein
LRGVRQPLLGQEGPWGDVKRIPLEGLGWGKKHKKKKIKKEKYDI